MYLSDENEEMQRKLALVRNAALCQNKSNAFQNCIYNQKLLKCNCTPRTTTPYNPNRITAFNPVKREIRILHGLAEEEKSMLPVGIAAVVILVGSFLLFQELSKGKR